jgi:enterochelin esterase family protein
MKPFPLSSPVAACAVAAAFSILCAPPTLAREIPKHGPDSEVHPNVPKGEVTKGTFVSKNILPGTSRDYWVYVPKQYDGKTPAHLVVFQDGGGCIKPDGAFRVPVVLDNLIAKGDIPVTLGVFLNPGSYPPAVPGAAGRSNRSFEYDSLGDRYARFLTEEFLPEVLKGMNVSSKPEQRAVAGVSSGGICAFTVAWEKPDQFGCVLSGIGSFTNIRGGFDCAAQVRKTKGQPKPIRVWMQEGESDLDNLHGHWPLANEDLAAALKFAGYTYHFEMTGGGHNGTPLGTQLPDAFRWLWGAKRP